MSQAGLVPSIEVDAIKKQLKLLGHSLPTDVIVKFLQENNDLLTACQQPLHQTRRAEHFSRDHTGLHGKANTSETSQPGFPVAQREVATAPRALPPTPELDLTWASRGVVCSTSQDVLKDRGVSESNLGGMSHSLGGQELFKAQAVRGDNLDQLQCMRDEMSQSVCSTGHRASDMGFGLASSHSQLKHRKPLQDGFDTLSRELDELAASFCRDTRSKAQAAQPQLGSRAKAFPSAHAAIQQESKQTAHANTSHAEHASDADLAYSSQLQSLRDELRSISRQADLVPDSDGFATDARLDQYDQKVREIEKQGLRPHASRPGRDCEQDRFMDNDEQDRFMDSFGGSHLQHNRAKQSVKGYSPSPRSVLGCCSQRSLPVLNNSFIVPAQAAKPKKVDRVSRYRELQQVWNKDAFLRSGGCARTSKRKGQDFSGLYAACHAAEDKLKDLTLKHGQASRRTVQSKENIVPVDKRRDALRWETRIRMHLRDDS